MYLVTYLLWCIVYKRWVHLLKFLLQWGGSSKTYTFYHFMNLHYVSQFIRFFSLVFFLFFVFFCSLKHMSVPVMYLCTYLCLLSTLLSTFGLALCADPSLSCGYWCLMPDVLDLDFCPLGVPASSWHFSHSVCLFLSPKNDRLDFCFKGFAESIVFPSLHCRRWCAQLQSVGGTWRLLSSIMFFTYVYYLQSCHSDCPHGSFCLSMSATWIPLSCSLWGFLHFLIFSVLGGSSKCLRTNDFKGKFVIYDNELYQSNLIWFV